MEIILENFMVRETGTLLILFSAGVAHPQNYPPMTKNNGNLCTCPNGVQ